MITRWEPELFEAYWYVYNFVRVSTSLWMNDRGDNRLYDTGNCFKTKEQAEMALEKIKQVLMGVHDEK